jgi:DNA-binding transcriptional LysR family regulator
MLYLTLRHYEYVCAVARHGSLSAAAEALHVSQPALSAALTRIEAQLGQTLFLRRRGAPLALTPQGREFTARAEALVAQAAALETPGRVPEGSRRLVIGCFTDLAPFLLAPALRLLRAALPGVALDSRALPFEPLIESLTSGAVDLAITYDLGLDAGFDRHQAGERVPHVLVAPDHALAGRAGVALEDLAEHPLILSLEGLSAQHMLGLFRRRGLVPRVAHRAASLELMRSLAANGEGAGLAYSLPPGGISYDGKPVAAVSVSDQDAVEPLVIASHGKAASAAAQQAIEILSRELTCGA